MTFGQRLKKMRQLSGLSQEKLAVLTGMTHRGICYLEADQRKPRPSTVLRLNAVFGHNPEMRLNEFLK